MRGGRGEGEVGPCNSDRGDGHLQVDNELGLYITVWLSL